MAICIGDGLILSALVEYGFGEKQGPFLRWHGSPCKQKSKDWTSIPPTAQNAALLGTER